MVIGDLNYDILTPDKSQVLDDLCDIFDLTNIVKNPTCFMKGYEPSLVDVILTNKNNLWVSILYGCMMINDLRDFSFKIIIHSVYIIYTLTRIM
jgi:hypothetical protein